MLLENDKHYMMPECLPCGMENLPHEEPPLAQTGNISRNLSLRLKIGAVITDPDMPRKRRPAPPSIPIRNIAPRPDPDSPNPSRPRVDNSNQTSHRIPTPSSSRQSTAGSEAEPGSCGVPQCPIPNCNLETHRNYGRQRRALLLQKTAQLLPTPALTEASSSLTLKSNSDPQLVLPIDDTTGRDFHHLFTTFFQPRGPFERIVLIGRPTRQRDQSFKQTLYRLALKNPIYCMTMVALSHMEATKASPGIVLDPETVQLTDTIYTKLLTMTREKVSNLENDNETDVDILIYAIVALCEFDLRLDRHDALRAHHSGLIALVARKGGVHNLGLSLPYVLRMDRFLAVRANEMPQFAALELPSSENFAQNMPSSETYFGEAFQDESLPWLREPVRSLCTSAAHLLALMDELNVTFDPNKASDQPNPKLEFFYFLREHLEARHAVLNHQVHSALESAMQTSTTGPSRALSITNVRKNFLALTAMRIVTYYIATGNYLPVVSETLSARVWSLLTKSTDPSSGRERLNDGDRYTPTISLAEWTDDMPLLLWILFACALPGCGDGTLTFADHIDAPSPPQARLQVSSSSSASVSPDRTKAPLPSSSRSSSKSTSKTQRIVSPSSPRRHRYLPTFILHVAEHLVGERPLSGTDDWDEEVIEILEGFVWNSERVDMEFSKIIARVHEGVVRRAEEEEAEDEDEEEDE